MGFFLVGRTSSGELALISPEVFGTRQEALNALTTISADPAFSHRESEVFVGNLDQATPILLVAPAAPAVEAPLSEPAPETAAEEPEPADEIASDAGVWEAPEEEAPEEEAPEEAPEEGESLAGAIKRATGALESEGIVAPESIGPEIAEESQPEPVDEPEATDTAPAEIAWPWDAGASVSEPEPAAEEPEPEAAEEPEPEAAEEPAPEPEAAEEPEPQPEPEPEAAEEPTPEPAAYVPDPFEEPSVDGDDIVSLRADDETVALGRPVVMGAYAEDNAVVEPASVAGPDAEPQAEEVSALDAVVAETADTDALDGILADLEPIEDAPTGFAGSDSDEALTCADCVYEQTCPNKEGLDPSQCGNFQWKAH